MLLSTTYFALFCLPLLQAAHQAYGVQGPPGLPGPPPAPLRGHTGQDLPQQGKFIPPPGVMNSQTNVSQLVAYNVNTITTWQMRASLDHSSIHMMEYGPTSEPNSREASISKNIGNNFLYKIKTPTGQTKSTLWHTVQATIVGLMAFVAMLYLCHMMPGGNAAGGGGGGNEGSSSTNYRVPPTWSPEMERSYPFRSYVRDVLLWSMLTDLLPHQQAAAMVLRLKGAARSLVNMLSPEEILRGGEINGVAYQPVEFILKGLETRFARFDDEIRINAMLEMMNFRRKGHERINELVARFHEVRFRSITDGNLPKTAMAREEIPVII